MLVASSCAAATVVLKVGCYAVCVAVRDRFAIVVPLRDMFLDFVANNFTSIVVGTF